MSNICVAKRAVGPLASRGAYRNWIPLSVSGMNLIGHDGDHGLQEGGRRYASCLLNQLSKRELAGPVYGDDQIQLAFSGSHFRDIDVEVADRVALKALLWWRVALDFGWSEDTGSLQTAEQRRPCEMRQGRLKGIQAVKQSSSGSRMCHRKATTTASSSTVGTVD